MSNDGNYGTVVALIERCRVELAALAALPPLPAVAGGLTGVLRQTWEALSDEQRFIIASAIAAVELYGGGNEVYELARERLEQRTMREAGAALERIRRGAQGPSGEGVEPQGR